jgi:hypothetical protein
VAQRREQLAGLTPRQLPELMSGLEAWSEGLPIPVAENGDRPDRKQYARHLLGSALFVALRREGFTVRFRPGEALTLEHDGQRVATWDTIEQLADGRLSPDAFRALCDEAGLPECDLGAVAAAAT